MPIKSCQLNGKPGFKWGNTNKCWTYTPGNEASKKTAKKNCINQAIKIEGPDKFAQIQRSGGSDISLDDMNSILWAEDTSDELFETIAYIIQPPTILDKVIFNEQVEAKKLTRKSINNLPDSDFAYIESGGKKDGEGKTTPRSLRHFPIHDAVHARNALARLPQSNLPAAAKTTALKKIRAACKKFGIKVSDESK